MARKLKPNGGQEQPAAGHNVADLAQLIRESAGTVVAIKGERHKLNERMGKVRKRLREAGVETKAFEFAVRVAEMEEEIRTHYVDQLRVNFEALDIGGQGSLFVESQQGAESQPSGA